MWVESLARLGYATKGLLYLVLGFLATSAAFGLGGKATDPKGAIATLAQQPFSNILLSAIALGFMGYAVWCLVQAFLDPEDKGTDAKAIIQRSGDFLDSFSYLGLAFTALQLLFGGHPNLSSEDISKKRWTAQLLNVPFGEWVVAFSGVMSLASGISFFYRAYKPQLKQTLYLGEMNEVEVKWAIALTRLGFVSRGIILSTIGLLLLQAAWEYNANKAEGVRGALNAIAGQPFGHGLLAFVSLGLAAYGIYNLLQARYRRI